MGRPPQRLFQTTAKPLQPSASGCRGFVHFPINESCRTEHCPLCSRSAVSADKAVRTGPPDLRSRQAFQNPSADRLLTNQTNHYDAAGAPYSAAARRAIPNRAAFPTRPRPLCAAALVQRECARHGPAHRVRARRSLRLLLPDIPRRSARTGA